MGCCLLNFNPSICFILKRLQSSRSASVVLFLRAFPNVVILSAVESPPPLPSPVKGEGKLFASLIKGEGILFTHSFIHYEKEPLSFCLSSFRSSSHDCFKHVFCRDFPFSYYLQFLFRCIQNGC